MIIAIFLRDSLEDLFGLVPGGKRTTKFDEESAITLSINSTSSVSASKPILVIFSNENGLKNFSFSSRLLDPI